MKKCIAPTRGRHTPSVSTHPAEGDVAQLVERALSMREVRGSKPCVSTNLFFFFSSFFSCFSFLLLLNQPCGVWCVVCGVWVHACMHAHARVSRGKVRAGEAEELPRVHRGPTMVPYPIPYERRASSFRSCMSVMC